MLCMVNGAHCRDSDFLMAIVVVDGETIGNEGRKMITERNMLTIRERRHTMVEGIGCKKTSEKWIFPSVECKCKCQQYCFVLKYRVVGC